TVTLKHDKAPNTVVTTTAKVSDPAVIGQGVNFTASKGVAFSNQTVATFTDPAGPEKLSDYSAVINWGDGTATTTGTISGPDGSGKFTVTGGHTFAADGTYTITVTLKHDTAPDTVVTSTAVVGATQLVGKGVPVDAVEGNPFNGSVATF